MAATSSLIRASLALRSNTPPMIEVTSSRSNGISTLRIVAGRRQPGKMARPDTFVVPARDRYREPARPGGGGTLTAANLDLEAIDAVIFDLDGVVTQTAKVHARAWKRLFDDYLEAARRLGVEPGRSAIVEDALAGVEAGRRGAFALVIGVDRGQQQDELASAGADVVVNDLAEVTV
jgi:hypothetical protein